VGASHIAFQGGLGAACRDSPDRIESGPVAVGQTKKTFRKHFTPTDLNTTLNRTLNIVQTFEGARMPRNRLAAAALAAVLATTLVACGGGTSGSASNTPVQGGTLHVLRATPFEGFDLDKETLNSTLQISQSVIEPLIRVGEDGKSLAPGIAASWSYNKSNTALTIKINPDAKFSNGKPVTADDVAFSVDRWKAGPNYGASFAGIKSVQKVDDKTVILHLAAPDTSLVAFLSWAIAGVVPKDFGGQSAADYFKSPIGAGAFKVEKWSANGDVVLAKNPDYYQPGRPYVDKVVSSFASDPNSVTLQLRSGQADMADDVLPVTASTLPKGVAHAGPEHSAQVLVMNTKVPGLADVDVRRGIGYAINFDDITKGAFKGFGTAPTGALPTNLSNWAPPSVPYFTHDVEKAKSLLAGKAPKKLQLLYSNDATSSAEAQIVQDNLAEVGITVQIKSADRSTAFGAMASGNYQMMLFSYSAISPDASDPAWFAVATHTIFTGFPVGDAVRILTDYAATDSKQAKMKAITRLQDLWTNEAPFIALANTRLIEAINNNVHGAHVAPWGIYYFDTIWKK